jgi:hypothetical protein
MLASFSESLRRRPREGFEKSHRKTHFALTKTHFAIDRVFRRVAHLEARKTKDRFETRDDERNGAFEALADSKVISLPDRSLMRRYELQKIRV